MRRRLNLRWAIVAAAVLAALWYLYPTYRFYAMTLEEREELRLADPVEFDELQGRAIKLGLDLQGGMHLELEIDESERAFTGEERRDAVDRALEIIRNRVDQFGVSEPLIQKVGDERIIVELPGLQDRERAKDLVQQAAFLEFTIAADDQTFNENLEAIDRALAGRTLDGDAGADETATEPADTTVAPDTTGADAEESRPLGEFLGETDTAAADAGQNGQEALGERPLSALLSTQPTGVAGHSTYFVEERLVPRVRQMLETDAAREATDDDHVWLWSGTPATFADGRQYRALYLVERDAQLTGERLSTASASFDPLQPTVPIVNFELDSEGASEFAQITGAHVNERLAIVLDDIVRMAPNIRQRIPGGSGRIEGFDDIEEARDLAIVLRAGALPAPLEIIEERTVGPSLGAESIRQGRNAFILGLLAVAVFMVFYYRASGLVANVALTLNIVLIMAALAAFGATLTLPGIAGLILTVGMAVDANVLVFERVREELDIGKSVRAAIDAGYDRALVTILDAQITTLIAAAVLFQFGTGPVKGFAVVLSIGIVSSIFTAVFVTRTLFETWSQNRPAERLSI